MSLVGQDLAIPILLVVGGIIFAGWKGKDIKEGVTELFRGAARGAGEYKKEKKKVEQEIAELEETGEDPAEELTDTDKDVEEQLRDLKGELRTLKKGRDKA